MYRPSWPQTQIHLPLLLQLILPACATRTRRAVFVIEASSLLCMHCPMYLLPHLKKINQTTQHPLLASPGITQQHQQAAPRTTAIQAALMLTPQPQIHSTPHLLLSRNIHNTGEGRGNMHIQGTLIQLTHKNKFAHNLLRTRALGPFTLTPTPQLGTQGRNRTQQEE